jgi:carbon-monoxide dehydrogenase small subunit
VLDAQIETVAPPPKPVPLALPIAAAQAAPMPKGTPLTQSLRIGLSPDIVWAAIQNPEFVAACVPGAGITTIAGNRITGEMQAGLGPIQARFTGTATLDFDQSARSGRLAGTGQDSASNTRLSAEVVFTILPDGADATQIRLDIAYALRGGLAQFSRGPIVSVFAAEIAATVARNLEARLRGTALPAAPRLGAATLLRIVWGAFRRWLGRHG